MVAYFLQVNVCWLLFYGAYYALLSKETFFRLNRLWLITSLLCGLALPFVADYFAVKVVPTELFVATLEPIVVTATALQHDLELDTEGVVLHYLALGYLIGVVALASRFLAGLFLIFKLFLQSRKEKKDGFLLVYTEGGVPPFSFFKLIFINPNDFDAADYQQIMQHEEAHVRQRHSFDVVFMELLNIVFWCSPLVYFYKESLRNIHEYLADEAVLRLDDTPQYKQHRAQYGRLLLRQQQSGMVLSLTSNISNHFFSQLKKRILMMTRNKSKRTALIKYALAVPIFLILTAALASPKTPILAKTEVLSEAVVASVDNFAKEKLAELKTTQSMLQNGNTRFPNMKEGDIVFYIGSYRNDGKITASEMKNAKELEAIQIINGKEVACEITSFVIVRIARQQDPQQVNVSGATNDALKKLLALAKEGDMFQFLRIRGIAADNPSKVRDFGSMSFLVVPNSEKVDELPVAPTKQNSLDTLPQIKEGEAIAYVGNYNKGGIISVSELQKIDKLNIVMKVNGKLEEGVVQSYIVVRIPKDKSDPMQVNVTGNMNEPLKKLLGMAQGGDQYQFFQIRARWTGDFAVSDMGSLSLLVTGGVPSNTKPVPNNIDPNDVKSMNVEKDEVKGNSVTIEMKDGTIYVLKGEELEQWKKENEKSRVKVIAPDKTIHKIVDENPEFPQGQTALFKWLGDNIQYPKEAKDNKIEGTVYVGFVVNTDGSITDVTVKRGIGGGCNQEALRVVSAMPDWKPGKQKGQLVRVAYTLPIKFQLEQGKKEVAKLANITKLNKIESKSENGIYTIVEENPEFPQGQTALFKWLTENIKYPTIAREAGGQGTVYVGFVVEVDGSITNVNIKRDAAVIIRDTITILEANGLKGNKIIERTDYSLGREAMRVISAMPKWKPGKSKGVPVRVAYTLPIKFKLE